MNSLRVCLISCNYNIEKLHEINGKNGVREKVHSLYGHENKTKRKKYRHTPTSSCKLKRNNNNNHNDNNDNNDNNREVYSVVFG